MIELKSETHTVTVLFFDKPNMDFVEKGLDRKIDHYKFFTFLAQNENELHVRFYWRTDENEYSSPYTGHLKQLRINLQAYGVRFESIETDKDVDIAILNDIFTILFGRSTKPAKVILCSGDKAFSIMLGEAKRRFDIPTTVISGKNHCAEILKIVLDETIFIEDIIRENENLLLNSSNSNE